MDLLDPHADPHGERVGKGQRVPDGKFALPVRLFSLPYMICAMKLPISGDRRGKSVCFDAAQMRP